MIFFNNAHYTIAVKMPVSDKWYLCNDMNVSEFHWEHDRHVVGTATSALYMNQSMVVTDMMKRVVEHVQNHLLTMLYKEPMLVKRSSTVANMSANDLVE